MVTRLDLDGTHSPMGLVGKILAAEPNLKVPVPIEDLARQLDISEIGELETDNFEGGLITDQNRSYGGILVRKGVSRQRRRFTIGHELCHFLNPYHKPAKAGEFLCDKDAMRSWDTKFQQRALKMEIEANQFSALLLMPPPKLRPIIRGKRFSSLSTVLEISETFDVSKEAAARAFAEYSDEPVAVVVVRNGRYLRSYRNRDFPWIAIEFDNKIPEISALYTHTSKNQPSRSEATAAEFWLETEPGKRIPKMYEQVLHQANGFAMILLKVLEDPTEDYDPDENLTSKQRFQKRQDRWGV